MAGSSSHGTLVAPKTKTPSCEVPIPCICTRNSVLILRVESLSPSERFEHNESISSIKMMDGFFCRANSNRFFTSLYVSSVSQATVRSHNRLLFTFSLPFRNQCGRRNRKKGRVCFGCNCFGQVWFPCSWWLHEHQLTLSSVFDQVRPHTP